MIYQHKPAILTVKECEALQVRRKDMFGNKWPWKGHYLAPQGKHTYNGGCVRDGEWYEGEYYPRPILPKGWVLGYIPNWGYHIVRDDETCTEEIDKWK